MHELSIAMSIVEVASEEAQRQGGARVEAVHLKLGALSGVVKDALLFSWDLACEDSPIAGAKLEIEEARGTELEVTALEIEDG
ncbi:MAG TPA: hydrogenase maturation nickel metallochaperone HypA [Candidatus Solibacter sp.]